MQAETTSCLHLSWYIPFWMHATSHTSPAQWPLCSLVLPSCTMSESASCSPDSPAACPSSAFTSPHWCLSPGWHLPGSCHAAGRLDTHLLHPALLSLVVHAVKIYHSLGFLRKLGPKHWVGSLPTLCRTALPGYGFAHLCWRQLSQQASLSQSVSGAEFSSLTELGPHLERWAPHCECLSFVPENLTSRNS